LKPIPANYGEVLLSDLEDLYGGILLSDLEDLHEQDSHTPHTHYAQVRSLSRFDSVMLLLIAAICLVVIFYAIALVVGLIIFIFSHISEILGILALLFILALIS